MNEFSVDLDKTAEYGSFLKAVEDEIRSTRVEHLRYRIEANPAEGSGSLLKTLKLAYSGASSDMQWFMFAASTAMRETRESIAGLMEDYAATDEDHRSALDEAYETDGSAVDDMTPENPGEVGFGGEVDYDDRYQFSPIYELSYDDSSAAATGKEDPEHSIRLGGAVNEGTDVVGLDHAQVYIDDPTFMHWCATYGFDFVADLVEPFSGLGGDGVGDSWLSAHACADSMSVLWSWISDVAQQNENSRVGTLMDWNGTAAENVREYFFAFDQNLKMGSPRALELHSELAGAIEDVDGIAVGMEPFLRAWLYVAEVMANLSMKDVDNNNLVVNGINFAALILAMRSGAYPAAFVGLAFTYGMMEYEVEQAEIRVAGAETVISDLGAEFAELGDNFVSIDGNQPERYSTGDDVTDHPGGEKSPV